MSPPTCTFPHAPTPPPPSTWSQSTTLSSLCYTATFHAHILTSPDGASGKESAYQYRRCRRHRFYPWVGKMPWRRAWQPTPVFLPGEPYAQRRLVGLPSIGLRRVGHEWRDRTCMLITNVYKHICRSASVFVSVSIKKKEMLERNKHENVNSLC